MLSLGLIGGVSDVGLVDSVQHRSSLDSWRERGAYGPETALAQEAPRATPTASDVHTADTPELPPLRAGEGLPSLPIAAFIRGYRDLGGNRAWERRFIEVVIPCENGWHWDWGQSFHLSVAQFEPGSWATAAEATGLADPENLYHVGAAVAWWSNEVGPEAPAGWACF